MSRMCCVDGCSERHHARGYCRIHYKVDWRERHADRGGCAIDGCTRPVMTRGLCAMHVYRDAHGLDMHAPAQEKYRQGCMVDGCERRHCARGYCEMHYARWRKHGDPLVVIKRQPVWSEKTHAKRNEGKFKAWKIGNS